MKNGKDHRTQRKKWKGKKMLDQEIKKTENYYTELKWTGESGKGGTIVGNRINYKK
jgi:hypothetical protein